MARVRFNTDLALFETFPSARDHVATTPAGAHPLVFLHDLVARDALADAVSFCAYLLPRREAVAWACRGVRPHAGAAGQAALSAAEAWVAAPDEDSRRLAHARWTDGDREAAATWLALAAAWSGGRLSPDRASAPPAGPHLTASAVRVALLLTLHRLPPAQKAPRVRAWIAEGARIAESGL